jgi:hypothetical protein
VGAKPSSRQGLAGRNQIIHQVDRSPWLELRIVQPNLRLIAFDRLRGIAPKETRSFQFDVHLQDKLGVWDVEASTYVVEPGTYRIKAAHSSADPASPSH